MDAFVRQALGKGLTPSRTASDALILRDGRQHKILVGVHGQVTPAGRAYEGQRGESLPREGFDPDQRPLRRGK